MAHRHKRKPWPAPGAEERALWIENLPPARRLVVIGAGSLVGELLQLARLEPGVEVAGILDPAPSLQGQQIQGHPVLGWLGDLPSDVTLALIGNPAGLVPFDRESVFRMLLRRGIALPIFRHPSIQIAKDVFLPRGTVLMAGVEVEEGAALGENCLLGSNSRVQRCARVPAHACIPPETEVSLRFEDKAAQPQPKTLKATLAQPEEPIRDIIQRLNHASMEIILVTNGEGRLQGTVTDGDVRRGILAGVCVDQPVSLIMNRQPTTVPIGASHAEMLEIMRQRSIRHLPVVDNLNRPVRLERMETILDHLAGPNAIVMAGGLGARLRPLTNDLPKPLIPVAGKPILDHILGGLRQSGIEDVVISVNYLAERIRAHVGDGAQHQLNVNYVAERERLGTAGALALLRPRPKHPFLVMNGDLLTRVNFTRLLEFQQRHGYPVVMCVRKHQTQVPYGVVDIRGEQVAGLREKPVYEHFINAGIYVLAPACIDLIPRGRFFDMTDLVQVVMRTGGQVGAFPIVEYWRDIGRPEDIRAANEDQLNIDPAPPSAEAAPATVPMEALV